MLTEHPISHGLKVARACAELVLDAMAYGSLPKPMAATLSDAAREASDRLKSFCCTYIDTMPSDLRRVSICAQVNLAAISELAELLVTSPTTPRDVRHIAKNIHYMAGNTVDYLTRAEGAIYT
ncbi:hypothetical protein [Dyella solisilvae]|uniref:hypothetical protein n=1 Tax=Dyella solisilvae TaxID=1920168 RepID=UPI0011C01782|nr:hypothetical protein [Dyella solisilvae]